MSFRILVLLFWSLVIACGIMRNEKSESPKLIDLNKAEHIKFTTGACIGPCDVSTLIIEKEGMANLSVKPLYGAVQLYWNELSPSSRDALWETIDAVNWVEMKDDYGTHSEDMTPKSLSVVTNDVTKEIVYKHGEPMAIRELENQLQMLIDAEGWQKMNE